MIGERQMRAAISAFTRFRKIATPRVRRPVVWFITLIPVMSVVVLAAIFVHGVASYGAPFRQKYEQIKVGTDLHTTEAILGPGTIPTLVGIGESSGETKPAVGGD